MRVKLSDEERLKRQREANLKCYYSHHENRLEYQRAWRKTHPEESKKRAREATRKWRQIHRAEYIEAKRKRNKEHREELREASRKRRKINAEKGNTAVHKWQKEHPIECLASRKARKNILLADTCELCGDKAQHRHHEDYSNPLKVVHLCASCHKLIHTERRNK